MVTPVTEEEALLADVFGADWPMYLAAAGVFGHDDDVLVRELVTVIDLAAERIPHWPRGFLDSVAEAWVHLRMRRC